MKDLGPVRMFVGIEIIRDRKKHIIALHQHRYIDRMLKLFNMHGSNAISIPLDPNSRLHAKAEDEQGTVIYDYQQRVGKLMYAMIGTRPDLAYIELYQHSGDSMPNPSLEHAGVMKRTLRFLRHTQGHGLVYVDWAGDTDTRRSTTGYVFIVAGAVISWKSRRQLPVARSSTEADYMAVTEAASGLFVELTTNPAQITHN